MRYVMYIATFVAILFYCLSAPPAAGAPHEARCINNEYTKMYLQEKANLTRHTWTRIGSQRYEPVATHGFLEILDN